MWGGSDQLFSDRTRHRLRADAPADIGASAYRPKSLLGVLLLVEAVPTLGAFALPHPSVLPRGVSEVLPHLLRALLSLLPRDTVVRREPEPPTLGPDVLVSAEEQEHPALLPRSTYHPMSAPGRPQR